jgi:hypothetical protein
MAYQMYSQMSLETLGQGDFARIPAAGAADRNWQDPPQELFRFCRISQGPGLWGVAGIAFAVKAVSFSRT